MASTSETGHAKNVANFQDVIDFVTGYGPTYNPSKTAIQLPQLITLQGDAAVSVEVVITKNTAFNNSVNTRKIAFSDVKALSTRLLGALSATDATPQTIEDAEFYNHKIQGLSPEAKTPLDPNAPPADGRSTSQQSCDMIIEHLKGLKSVLESEPSYAPNETDLTIVALEAKIEDLTMKNKAVGGTYTEVSNSRIDRDAILYDNKNSVFEIVKDVKEYVKSVYNASSPEYAQIKGIEIKKIKK